MVDNALEILGQTDGKTIDLTAIPFDSFYTFLDQNTDFKKGKLVGELLLKKFKESFLELPQEYLPVGINPNWNLNNAKKQAERVFAQHTNNMDIYRQRRETGSSLVKSIYGYHNALLGSVPDTQAKAESLQTIKTLLQPFFTDELQQQEAPKAPKPNFWKRVFG